MKRVWVISLLAVGMASVVLAAFYFLPTHDCCEQGDQEYAAYEILVVRATSGDTMAARKLFEQSSKARHNEEARKWALIGAINGDTELAAKYVVAYQALSIEARKGDEIIIKKNASKEGARHLAGLIGLSL